MKMMKTTQHTPGPWSVSTYGNVMKKTCTVAKIEQMPGDFDSEKQANANLIAAAPELLEALQEIVCTYGFREPDIREIARVAIAKAVGEL